MPTTGEKEGWKEVLGSGLKQLIFQMDGITQEVYEDYPNRRFNS